jgi:predicted kinase
MQKLILITGDLAAGKSTLAKKLSEKLNTLCFTKDVLKEILSDDIGFSNRQENKKLSIASISVMNHIFYQYAFLKQDLILEANFHKEEIEILQNLANQHGYKVIILYLQGETDYLFERFTNRIKNENRHPTHCTSDIIEKENFTKYLLSNREELKDFDYKLIKIQGENYSEVLENAVKIINS